MYNYACDPFETFSGTRLLRKVCFYKGVMHFARSSYCINITTKCPNGLFGIINSSNIILIVIIIHSFPSLREFMYSWTVTSPLVPHRVHPTYIGCSQQQRRQAALKNYRNVRISPLRAYQQIKLTRGTTYLAPKVDAS